MTRTLQSSRTSLTGVLLPRRAALAALLLPLAACAPGASDRAPAPEDDPGTATAEAHGADGADGITVADPWAKAAEDGMTAAFGTITSTGESDRQLVGARTAASSRVELHETVADGSGGMGMTEKEGGFPLPAGGELVLEPGGNHLMLMELTAPLLPGDEVELILEFADGGEHAFTATVKDFAGAQEHYEHGEDE